MTFRRAKDARAFAKKVARGIAAAKSWRKTKTSIEYCVKTTVPGDGSTSVCFPTLKKARSVERGMKREFLDNAKHIEGRVKKLKSRRAR